MKKLDQIKYQTFCLYPGYISKENTESTAMSCSSGIVQFKTEPCKQIYIVQCGLKQTRDTSTYNFNSDGMSNRVTCTKGSHCNCKLHFENCLKARNSKENLKYCTQYAYFNTCIYLIELNLFFKTHWIFKVVNISIKLSWEPIKDHYQIRMWLLW